MDNLNAGAATFTPGGPPAVAAAADDGYPYGMEDTSDGRNMDEIEAAISAEQQSIAAAAAGGGGTAARVTYTDLPPHAEEFWFPECRDCTCCKGYKHGCSCCTQEGKRSCKCAPSTGPTTTATASPPVAAAAASGPWQPAMPGPGTANISAGGGGRGYYGGGSGRGGGRSGGGGRGPQMCRFFTSPGGCRFGDSCRFSHGY